MDPVFGPSNVPLSVETSLALNQDYFSLCAEESNRVFSTLAAAPAGGMLPLMPYFQVDLGQISSVSDVQLWTGVKSQDWLSPISVYVTNTTSLLPTDHNRAAYYPCFSYGPDTQPRASVQKACAPRPNVGRFVTAVLTGNNSAHPTQNQLRLCAMLVFGSPIAPPPPPPPPPPRHPPPAAAPDRPPSLSWQSCLALIIGGLAVLSGATSYALHVYYGGGRRGQLREGEGRRGGAVQPSKPGASWGETPWVTDTPWEGDTPTGATRGELLREAALSTPRPISALGGRSGGDPGARAARLEALKAELAELTSVGP